MDNAEFTTATRTIESTHPNVIEFTRMHAGDAPSDVERGVRLFYAVRDGIRYDAYNLELDREAMRASGVLARGQSWCVPKSVLLAALCRAEGIACRLGYANVRNHMATRKLLEFLGTDIFYYHGYNEIFLGGRWVKATVAFNRTLCEKARLAPLDFDGEHDSIYHPFDLAGHRYMEYLHDYGAHADLPYDDLIGTFAERYPNVTRPAAGGSSLSGDFEADIAAESGS
jgi:transglutaminase-like putative cysteine protease